MSKILVVDDEPFILMVIDDKLSRAGHKVITSRQSKGIIEIVRKEKPDLIILDWMMPEVSGIDICQQLKVDSELANIPIIMLTAKGQEDDEKRGLMSGVDRYLTKPFSPKVLLKMVNEVVS